MHYHLYELRRRGVIGQSQPYPEMTELVAQLKVRHGLNAAVVSNEGREQNAYRIRTCNLREFIDFFISSCLVHIRKPDLDIFRFALDIAKVPAEQVAYIENTPRSSRLRKLWRFNAFFTRITSPPPRNWRS